MDIINLALSYDTLKNLTALLFVLFSICIVIIYNIAQTLSKFNDFFEMYERDRDSLMKEVEKLKLKLDMLQSIPDFEQFYKRGILNLLKTKELIDEEDDVK